MTSDWFGVSKPFEVACILMVISGLFVATTLPYVPFHPKEDADPQKESSKGILGFIAPAKVFLPQRYELPSGK
jgi:hypothetical protein